VDDSLAHLLFPEDRDTHDKNCKRPHHVPIPVTEFNLKKHMIIGDLVKREQTLSAKVSGKEQGGDMLLCLNQGGTLPPFVVSWNELNKNWKFAFSVESPAEEQALKDIYAQFQNHIAERRQHFLAKRSEDDAWCKSQCKQLLSKPSEDEKYADYARNMSVIFEPGKEGAFLRMIDAAGNPFSNPEQELPGRRWAEIWIHVRSVYKKTAGNNYEIGFSMRLVYMRLAADKSDFVLASRPMLTRPDSEEVDSEAVDHNLKNEDDTTGEEDGSSASAEPAPKKLRTG